MLNKKPNGKRRTLTPTLLLTLLVSALASFLFVNIAVANPMGYYYPWSPPPAPIVKVTSLNTDKLTLMFSVQKAGPWITPYGYGTDYEPAHEWSYSISSIRVWVDGKLWIRQEGCGTSNKISLEVLNNGWHTLEVTATAYGERDSSQGSSGVIEFQVDIPPPSISVITSQKTFEASSSTTDMPLNFTVNRSVSWVGYSIDGSNVITVTDDVTSTKWFGGNKYRLVLNGLHVGAHSLTVYAEDLGGNRGESEPFCFTVMRETSSETEQTSAPLSITTTAAASAIIASVAVISFGLVAYFVKRRRKRTI